MEDKYNPDFVTEFEIKTWDRCADNYMDTFTGITNETYLPLIDIGKITSGMEILEIGSGPGNFSDLLSKKGAKVNGIDFSEKMVDVAIKNFPHINFSQANAEEIPFKDNMFDVVVANFVVHHLARPEIVFQEVSRVLKKGGRFVFAVWGAPEKQASMGAFFGAVATYHDLGKLPHGPLYGITDKNIYETLFAQAGLNIDLFSLRQMTWNTASIDPVINGFSDWGNLTSLPQETQNNIINMTTENSKIYEKSGGYSFPHEILVGCAVKS